MAYIIIKTNEQQAAQEHVMREFGHDPRTASAEMRESAEITARKTQEAMREMGYKR